MTRPRPIVSGVIAAVCIGVFLYETSRGRLPFGLHGPAVTAGEHWRLLTYVLVHAGLIHLGVNLMVTFSAGVTLEQVAGSFRFILISFIGALGAGAFALFIHYPATTVGASGMILGWAGAMLPLVNRRGRNQMVAWLVQIAVLSLLPGVSWPAHLGGFVFGLASGFALRGGRIVSRNALPVLLFLAAVLAVATGDPARVAPLRRALGLGDQVTPAERSSPPARDAKGQRAPAR